MQLLQWKCIASTALACDADCYFLQLAFDISLASYLVWNVDMLAKRFDKS